MDIKIKYQVYLLDFLMGDIDSIIDCRPMDFEEFDKKNKVDLLIKKWGTIKTKQ